MSNLRNDRQKNDKDGVSHNRMNHGGVMRPEVLPSLDHPNGKYCRTDSNAFWKGADEKDTKFKVGLEVAQPNRGLPSNKPAQNNKEKKNRFDIEQPSKPGCGVDEKDSTFLDMDACPVGETIIRIDPKNISTPPDLDAQQRHQSACERNIGLPNEAGAFQNFPDENSSDDPTLPFLPSSSRAIIWEDGQGILLDAFPVVQQEQPSLIASEALVISSADVAVDFDEINMDLENIEKAETWYRKLILVGCIVVVLLVGGIVAATVVRPSGNTTSLQTSSPSQAPSESIQPSTDPSLSLNPSLTPSTSDVPSTGFEAQVVQVLQSRFPRISFDNRTSPQSMALDWIVQEDRLAASLLEDRLLQRYGLMVLWYATGGPRTWNNQGRGWSNPTRDECRWNAHDFDSCTEEGLVEKLLLRNHGLSQTLPPDIGLLTSLTWLSISENHLVGTIPTEMGWLTSLSRLYLHNNALEGSIPTEVVNLSQLDVLWLQGNVLMGTMPEQVCENGLSPHVDCNEIECTTSSAGSNCCRDLQGDYCPLYK